MKMRCDQCIYWVMRSKEGEYHPNEQFGECRRYPPIEQASTVMGDKLSGQYEPDEMFRISDYWQFPFSYGFWWCGEYTAKH